MVLKMPKPLIMVTISLNLTAPDRVSELKLVLNETVPKNHSVSVAVSYFALTHSSNINSRLDACLSTWSSRVQKHTGRRVVWYSNAPDPRIDHVISYRPMDDLDTLTRRMALVWKHVSENYPGFEWYARFWDDSYVIPATFEELIPASFDVNLPLEIGRLSLSQENGRFVPVGQENLINASQHPYIGGDSGPLLSRGGMERLVNGMDECFAWCRAHMWKKIPNWERVEDLTFGVCGYNLFGTRFKRGLGMYHGTHNVRSAGELLCRHEAYGAQYPSDVCAEGVSLCDVGGDVFYRLSVV